MQAAQVNLLGEESIVRAQIASAELIPQFSVEGVDVATDRQPQPAEDHGHDRRAVRDIAITEDGEVIEDKEASKRQAVIL